MKFRVSFILCVFCALWGESLFAAPPNIVVMIADDMGWEDSSPYGNAGVHTPNLARLAKSGMRFDKAFLVCSSCSPSRCSMITGRFPHAHGAERLHAQLPATQVTIAEKLREAGYWAGAAGKWHLGKPTEAKFDKLMIDKENGPSGCENWLPLLRARPKDKPFFAWLAAIDPHRPYSNNAVSRHSPADVIVPPYLPNVPEVRSELALYYDEISRLDSYVGEVLDELKIQGIEQNTFVLFLSDNGRPFPRCKTTVYDSGVRTPFLVRWPAGGVKPGSVCEHLVSSVDLAPTFAEIAGIPNSPTFQGKSFSPLLSDPSKPTREYIYAEQNWHDYTARERSVRSADFLYIRNIWNDLPGTPPADAVKGDAFQAMRKLRNAGKLTPEQISQIFAKPRPKEELYDCRKDLHQMKNLADSPVHRETLEKLRAELIRWQKETEDVEPANRPVDEFDRETGRSTKK
ncbi:sulfatase [soil metagenome]